MEYNKWIAEIADSEYWSSDIEGTTREEVIEEGMRVAKGVGLATFRIGKLIPAIIPEIDVDVVLDRAYAQVCNEVGEVAEGFLEGVTSEQQKELEEKLNEVFHNWIKKYKLEPNCYIVVDDEFIEVK